MNLRRNTALLASLISLMPMSSQPDPEPVLDLGHRHRNRPPSPPYSPPKREPPPLTPEQIKAQEKRARKAAKQKEQTNGT